ncbi:ATP-binding cassette domain-containing protein [Plantibacter sp. Mn2098]|uniref:ABC transporter ATP-binding protein n=1 Tax=Plantibacter sp. Mn2098 TaxID=3395266 RepID=UPI003BEDB9B4
MDTVIEAVGLAKKFGRVHALDGLDLSIDEGEVHGFLGPNGAGKSTTLRVLLGLTKRSGGSVSVLGLDPWRDAVAIHRRLAYVPGDVSLWPNLSGGETIDLLAGMRGGADQVRRKQLVDDFELDVKKHARSYSKGNRQKVALIAAFARRADLYLLDEPTSGLDPVMEAVFREQVRRVRAEGATVLLSSHILSEVEELCDRVTIIRAGVAVERGTLSEMRHLTSTAFTVVTDAPLDTIASLPGVLHASTGDQAASGLQTLHFDVSTDAVGAVTAVLAGHRIEAMTATPPSLEELFLRHYGDRVEAAS